MSRLAAWRASMGVAVAGLVLGLSVQGASRAQAIVNGTIDTEHRSVGSLVQRDSEGHLQARCSGFLASDSVFITANH
jgi:hypothetical protein